MSEATPEPVPELNTCVSGRCPPRKPASPMIKLMIMRCSNIMVERGGGTVGGVINQLIIGDQIKQDFIAAKQYVKSTVQAVRLAAEPNPYKHFTDDQIAQVILDRIEEKRKLTGTPTS